MTDRRTFLRSLGALALAGCASNDPPLPPGELLGPDLARGHRLTVGDFPPIAETRRVNVLIVGAGISGLSAAWRLSRLAVDDFLVLEMEREPGGNSRGGQSPLSAFPWGAHYLPLPGRGAQHVRELLAETGVLQGPADALKPRYDERFLCATPQERLFRHGLWEEGLLPQRGIDAAERDQQHRFQAHMQTLKTQRGRDGRRVFALPMATASRDPAWLALDRPSFRDWLLAEGYTAPSLHWLANYACRDDYGTDYARTSAWAGLHYFACRDGEAANASPDTVITAPDGNAWLMRALLKSASERLLTDAFVWRLESRKQGLTVDVLHDGKTLRIEARHVIWAAPHFILPKVWVNAPAGLPGMLEGLSCAPWLVANLHLSARPMERHGASPAWDNVLFDSAGLGYVDAQHQALRRHPGGTVLTWYRAFSELDPAAARRALRDQPRAVWAEQALSELARVLPDIRQKTTRVDIFRHGHAMARPTPGSLFGGRRARALAFAHPHLSLAHADLSGFSLFEEAQDRGVRAADTVRRRLRG